MPMQSSARPVGPHWVTWMVDTLAVTAFYTCVGALNEYFVAGLTFDQVCQTRLLALPILVATGALYGLWRDLCHSATDFHLRGETARTWIDTGTCLSFRVPVYGAILLVGGAEGAEFARGLAGGTVIILISGRPCGMAIDAARALVGLRARHVEASYAAQR